MTDDSLSVKVDMKMNRFKKFIIISLALHLALTAVMLLLPKLKLHETPVEVVLVSPEDETVNPANQPKPEEPANRIVETDEKTANQTLNEKAKYLSAKNNSVEKETQAKLGEKFQNAQAVPQKTVKAEQKSESRPGLFGEKFNAYDALEKKAGTKNPNKNQQANNNQREQNGMDRGQESTATDKIEGIDQTLKTALNTKEYKYYGYYQRIKKQLNQFWQPEVKQKVSRLMTQGRTIASENSKITKLIIVLNDAGTLVKVQVIGESGVRDLDDAAVDAFRQAAPFPNPPKGMVETDGTIKIRWDFVVES